MTTYKIHISLFICVPVISTEEIHIYLYIIYIINSNADITVYLINPTVCTKIVFKVDLGLAYKLRHVLVRDLTS